MPKGQNINLNTVLMVVAGVVVVYILAKAMGLIEPLDPEVSSDEQVEQPITEGTLAQGAVEMATDAENAAAEVAESRTQLVADDLLPKYDEANEFAEQNPVSKLLQEQNFLISGYHVGTNTVMQSTKIPYHDIRSAPPIPRESVGPWSQSSYETFGGAMQRKLE